MAAALWSAVGAGGYAGPGRQRPASAPQRPVPQQPQQHGGRRVVEFSTDPGGNDPTAVMIPVRLGPDSMALSLSGREVVFHHNGAVIRCDSAIRYNERQMDCFGNVVINKQDTYIYGDRVEYNGNTNTATVYAPIIKVIDKDAVMYTFEFRFNTLTNVGRFGGCGTVTHKDQRMESQRGYYYADTRTVVCVKDVQLQNEDYRMVSDSVQYNMDTEVADFYTRSYIWNAKGEMLSADRGSYDRPNNTYHFTSDAYIMTEDQEMWADTIDYNDLLEDAVLRRNIQMRDDSQRVMAFGDYGLYFGKREEAMLTRRPSALNYEEGKDTLYMRADSMFLHTVRRDAGEQVAGLAAESQQDELLVAPRKAAQAAARADSMVIEPTFAPDSTAAVTPAEGLERMDTAGEGDVKLSRRESKKLQRRMERDEKGQTAEPPPVAVAAPAEHMHGEEEEEDDHDHDHGHATVPEPVRILSAADSAALVVRADSALAVRRVQADSLIAGGRVADADSVQKDSMVRIVKGYRNVKIFRTDFQAVCDSLVGFSIDSTIHMYINPVMWNGSSQIKSDLVDVYTRNQSLLRATFVGSPIMISQVDEQSFNQVKGKTIDAWFRDNEIYRVDVDGNAESLYYMTEEDSTGSYVVGFLVATSSTITFYLSGQQVDRIAFRTDPDAHGYPLDQIPETQDTRLPGFSWEAERRPTLEEVFDRTIRPSRRTEYGAIPQPQFPLTEQIMRQRDHLVRDGAWTERNDRLSEAVLGYIRSLGY